MMNRFDTNETDLPRTRPLCALDEDRSEPSRKRTKGLASFRLPVVFTILLFGLMLGLQEQGVGQVSIFSEDFETDGNGSRYTTSVTEFTDGGGDYFTRTDGSDISGEAFSGVRGSYYFAAQDIDGDGVVLPVDLTFSGIDISGKTGLEFSIYLAEDDDGSNQDWDAADYVHIQYKIDGGDLTPLIHIESSGSSGTNFFPAIDTNFDGTGNGSEITDTFTQYTASISGTGSTLEIVITLNLDSGDEDIAFDDLSITAVTSPTITTGSASSITQTTATLAGNITSTGGADITERGVFWSTTDGFADGAGTKVSEAGTFGTGAFTEDVTGLSAGTTYYFKAFATNSAGTSYGSQGSFTTSSSATAPNVTTNAATSVTDNSATLNAEVVADGGQSVSERGFVYSSVDATPEIDEGNVTKVTSGSGTGSYTSDLTGLTSNTTYYVQGYAINSVGTSYGGVQSFTTPKPEAPATPTFSDVSGTSFTVNWVAVSGATSYEMDISTASDFGSFVSGYEDKSVSGTSEAVSGLAYSTTYYVRMRAVHTSGTSDNSGTGTQATTALSAPTVSAASSIGSNQFVANWSAVGGADGYRLDVGSTNTIFDNSSQLTEDFDSGLTTSYTSGTITLDSGDWTATSVYQETSTDSRSGFAARINDDIANAHITTPVLNTAGTVTFWYRELSTGGGTFKLQKSTDGTNFTDVTSQAYSGNTFTQFTHDVNDLSNPIYLRVLSDHNDGHLIIDDFEVTNYIDSRIEGFSNLTVASTSQTVTGLDANTNYYYRVRAVAGDATSANSSIQSVKTIKTPTSGSLAAGGRRSGYRLITTPVQGTTLQTLLADNNVFTQCFTGATSEADNCGTGDITENVFFFNPQSNTPSANDWEAATNITNAVQPGTGLLVYLFKDAPGGGNGFPTQLAVDGLVPTSASITINSGSNALTFIGNPFNSRINLFANNKIGAGGSNVRALKYVYDHNYTSGFEGNGGEDQAGNTGGGWRTSNGQGAGSLSGGIVAPFQGFFIQNEAVADASPDPITIALGDTTDTSGTLYSGATAPPAIQLAARINGAQVSDVWFSFSETGSLEDNRFDASALYALDYTPYLMFHAVSGGRALDIKNLPLDLNREISLPLKLNGWKPVDDETVQAYEPMGGSVEMIWPTVRNIPDAWEVYLTDHETGLSFDLTDPSVTKYEFELLVDAKSSERLPYRLAVREASVPEKFTHRFSLDITAVPTSIDPAEELPIEIALAQNYPNPFNPTTSIRFELPESQPIALEVYDLSGRHIATLASGVHTAGFHEVSFDASGLSSGVYLYRLQTESQTFTRKFTLLK